MKSVNEARRYTAKQEAVEQLGKVLLIITEDIAVAPEDDGLIFPEK